MALTVNALVYDAGEDVPLASDRFVVDTNVWILATYIPATLGQVDRERIANVYQVYLKRLRSNKASVFRNPLQLAEVGHVIETLNYKIYEQASGQCIKPKDYRRILTERQKNLNDIKTTWDFIVKRTLPSDSGPWDTLSDKLLKHIEEYPLDTYDAALLEMMHANNIDKIVTDDSDFALVNGIRMFTANSHVMSSTRVCSRSV
jgi:predicted nucleic acid-binding protein